MRCVENENLLFLFFSGVSPCVLCFRVKFYPEDPMKLREEITRYIFYSPGPEVIKRFSCSTQLSTKFILLNNHVRILTFY